MNEPACKSCGVMWRDHLGPTALCSKSVSLEVENQRLRELLRKVEWGLGAGRCPACFGANLDGHYPGCELAACFEELAAALNTGDKP